MSSAFKYYLFYFFLSSYLPLLSHHQDVFAPGLPSLPSSDVPAPPCRSDASRRSSLASYAGHGEAFLCRCVGRLSPNAAAPSDTPGPAYVHWSGCCYEQMSCVSVPGNYKVQEKKIRKSLSLEVLKMLITISS